MTENQTIKDRLFIFIKHLNIGQGKFEKACGLSNGYVNNIQKSINTDKFLQIINNFPELNRDWLLYGEGEMLNGNGRASVVTQTNEHIIVAEGDYAPIASGGDVQRMVGDAGVTEMKAELMKKLDAHHKKMLEEIGELKKTNGELISLLSDSNKEKQELLAMLKTQMNK